MAIYSPEVYETLHAIYTKEQCQNGGKKRAATAKRDRYGRMLPNNGDLSEPLRHGQAGGLATVKKYGKDYMRQLAKRRIKAKS